MNVLNLKYCGELEEASTSEGMKMYKKLKLKFKAGSKGIVKSIDPKREEQVQ